MKTLTDAIAAKQKELAVTRAAEAAKEKARIAKEKAKAEQALAEASAANGSNGGNGHGNGGSPSMYDLQAVSNHYGSTGGGHYTAFARHSESGQWHKFDDSHTAAVEPKDVCTPAAYVLIYVRRGTPSGGAAVRASPETL